MSKQHRARQENVSETMKSGLIAGAVLLAANALLMIGAVVTTRRIVNKAAAQLTGGTTPVTNPSRRRAPRLHSRRISHAR
jgi:hypothetical protein